MATTIHPGHLRTWEWERGALRPQLMCVITVRHRQTVEALGRVAASLRAAPGSRKAG